ncbi:acyl-CoA dehydrogenase [Aestuariirhabdus sp. LZHN29]|uniref:acyl-CoA dehydrogenase n=1 Tax=Aestuariirhabdus sp. LZHN29 TaxID=3417462 RepID=UPI003CEA5EA3
MTDQLLNDRDLDFLLYELLDTEQLLERDRYQEHSREVFNATLDTARAIATKYFANHNAKGDANEPSFDGERVHMIEETQAAWDAFAEAGFLAAHYDFDEGGLQMPEIILRSAMAYITAANVASAGYPFLTIGAANLIRTFGSAEQKALYLPPMQDGRFAGTMALTEPGQGSALADITTSARLQDDGSYRLFGQKMFISGGDQSLTDNIVHMVLAKIEGAPAGAKGISLFICPKVLVNADGSLGERNDVALAGLLHKMGYRNTTSTALSFGEKGGAKAWLVGEPHKGLGYMFQMMNEARIGVGMGAAILGYQGYNHSLDYARNRPQGRLPSNRDPASKQVAIVEHADVKRMLLAQKAYCEGSMALCFYASALYEDSHTAATAEARQRAFTLLDLLTPMVKSFPSRYGLKANELAIQVLGGSGYMREYPLEQYYRDNRLNPIHEGTEAIHGLDLLGRKVPMGNMAAYQLFIETVTRDLEEAAHHAQITSLATAVAEALTLLSKTTTTLLSRLASDTDLTLANATLYLDMFGRVVVAWIWVKQALAAARGLDTCTEGSTDAHFYQGKLQAARYYVRWELPEIKPLADRLQSFAPEAYEMRDEWF